MRNSWPKRGPKNVSTMADYIGRYVLVFMVATTEKCLSQNCLRFKGLYSNFRKYYFKYCQGDIMVFFSLSTICSVIKPSTYRYELLDQLLVPTENKLFCDSQFGWTLKLSVVARALSPARFSLEPGNEASNLSNNFLEWRTLCKHFQTFSFLQISSNAWCITNNYMFV